MTQSFDVDDHTVDALRDLWPVFGVQSNAKVLRKAIALARIVSRYADPDGKVVVKQGGHEVMIDLKN